MNPVDPLKMSVLDDSKSLVARQRAILLNDVLLNYIRANQRNVSATSFNINRVSIPSILYTQHEFQYSS